MVTMLLKVRLDLLAVHLWNDDAALRGGGALEQVDCLA